MTLDGFVGVVVDIDKLQSASTGIAEAFSVTAGSSEDSDRPVDVVTVVVAYIVTVAGPEIATELMSQDELELSKAVS